MNALLSAFDNKIISFLWPSESVENDFEELDTFLSPAAS